MTLTNDTVESNGHVPAAACPSSGGTATLANDTVESNSASYGGGPIVLSGAAAVSS